MDNQRTGRILSEESVVSIRRVLQMTLMIAMSVSQAAARDLAIVSNKTNALSGLTLAELVKVCKAQNNRWPDGKPVTFVMRAPSTPEMRIFAEKVYAMSGSEINNLIVAANHGRANHPAILIVASDDELLDRVASTPGAVGVVDVYAINSSVTVVKIAGKLPLEPGYLLHGN
jgi:ABC-type phosphate transport system substrate-binding protein